MLLKLINSKKKLIPDEFEIIKKHPVLGSKYILQQSLKDKNLYIYFTVVIQHHERMDGSGYPYGLFKAQIHPFASIVAVCDVFEAYTSSRSYHKSRTKEDGIKFIGDLAEKGVLDKGYVSKFLDKIG